MMQPLDKRLRNQLENIVVEARELAEKGARATLDELGVEEASPFPDQSAVQRELRRRLRVHGRQLGDPLNGGKAQGIDRLVEEVAYEHWHRMLFARFLAENALLMYPDPDGPVPVTLQDCEDLAVDEGAANGWELAARYAEKMLPQIFRVDSPAFELKLPTNFQRPLERLLADLPTEVFTASDALGWVYQFWQTNNKERINKSEVKIGARELPAVTQLFTEPYMVSFLLDNALGAWWAARRLSDADLRTAPDEETLRRKAAIPGVPLEYLRFVEETDEQGAKRWYPAAGSFPGWPEDLGKLKTLDPCCGSGHFLVSLLLMLVPMRMEMEGLDARQAVDAVLRENLHGLEIDQRCVELAAFALALTAWRYPGAGGYRKLPEIQVACSGLSVSVVKEEWKQLGLGRKNLTIALDWMHDAFRDAPVLGSLLNPAKTEAAKVVQWDELSTVLDQALNRERTEAKQEAAVVAQGLAKAAALLGSRYHLVVTNVPYLKAGDQCQVLKRYSEKHYPAAKFSLESTFMERCHDLLGDSGCCAIVTQQYWLFLKYYSGLREKFIKSKGLGLMARLGPGAFEEIGGAVVNVCLQLTFNRFNHSHLGIDVSNLKDCSEKAKALSRSRVKIASQESQLENADFRISFEIDSKHGSPLSNYADFGKGSVSGDGYKYIRNFWEFPSLPSIARYWLNSPGHSDIYSGRGNIILWGGSFDPEVETGFRYHGQRVHEKKGIGIGKAGEFRFTPYTGEIFDDNIVVVKTEKKEDISAIWNFAISGAFQEEVKKLDRKMSVTAGTFTKVRVDMDNLRQDAEKKFPNDLPNPFTNDPAQWVFHGHPCGSVIWDEESKWTAQDTLRTDETVLQVAVARLLGYRWPAELDSEMELATEQSAWVERSEALLPHTDDDGIVCIPPVRGEAAAAERLLNALAAAYGEQWSNEVLAKLLSSSGHAGKTLESWLRDKFFAQHCKLFQNRPFIWHVWDGLRDGFSALVNYHELDHKNLETLIYTYLGDWISRQKRDLENGVDGAREKLGAAETLKQRLELILEGEAPYDIFVRWKPLAEQPIGWNPDLNDGVRLNIRPFMTVSDIKKKGGGVLRDKPNIHWKKDRGKDVESAPWFNTFGGERINDHHLGLVEKLEARGDGG